MTEEERRKVFWLLKKYSSYTGWNELAQAYYAFADAWMEAMRLADFEDDEVEEWHNGHAKHILNGSIAFETGLALLKRGERTVFLRGHDRSFTAWGELAQGAYQLNFIKKIMDPEEYIFDWMKNQDEVIAANESLQDIRFGQESVLERMGKNVAPKAPWNALATLHPVYQLPMHDPKHMNFPETLAPVPIGSTITVETDSKVSFYGIYEPEWGEMASTKTGLLGKLKTTFTGQEKSIPSKPTLVGPDDEFPPPQRREHIGCMNYLLAGTSAPFYKDEEHGPVLPVTWRLIWKDTRYLDGTIPAEEGEYLAPVSTNADREAGQVSQSNVPAGQPCPEAGWWFTPAQASSRRYFKQGETMPSLGSDYGQTFWQWAPDQSVPKL